MPTWTGYQVLFDFIERVTTLSDDRLEDFSGRVTGVGCALCERPFLLPALVRGFDLVDGDLDKLLFPAIS